MKMKKWMSTALIVSLLAVNNQAMGEVKAFTSSAYVKSEVKVFNEEDGSVTPTPNPTVIPTVLGDYAVTYINEGETTTEGWYPVGKETTITLKTPEDRGRLWRFVGWEDSNGNLHEAGAEVEVYNVPSATFTAVWEAVPQGDFYATYIDGEVETHTGWYAIGYPHAITLKEPDAKEGYIFVGWKDYKGDLHQPGESVSISDVPSATFTAVWEQVEEIVTTPSALYSIIYVDGEYSNTCWYTVLNGRADFTIIEQNPKDGYVFVGWQNGNEIYQPGESVSLWDLSSTEFIAVWLELQETPGVITTVTPSAVVTPAVTPTITPSPTPTIAATPTMTPSPTPTITATPTIAPIVTPLGDYYGTYIDGDERQQFGWYPIGKTSGVKLKEPEPKEGYVFVGWKDYKGNIYQSGEEVEFVDMSSATFIAVWERLAEIATSSAIPTETLIPNVTPTVTPTATPVAKQAKVKITTSTKKKFVVGKKYTIKAKRTSTSKKLTWSVSNKKYATINKNTGVLKAKKAGKVTITVTCGMVKDKIKIVIKKK